MPKALILSDGITLMTSSLSTSQRFLLDYVINSVLLSYLIIFSTFLIYLFIFHGPTIGSCRSGCVSIS